MARLRQLAYSLFSTVLCYPDEGRIKQVAAAATCLKANDQEVAQFAFFPHWQRLVHSLGGLDRRSSLELEQEYISVFMHNAEGTPCPPYESAQVDPDGKATGWLMARLEAEYAAAGLALSPSLKEPPDHAAVELEFMGFLCGQEAGAWEEERQREATTALNHQAAFLDRHLLLWFPQWAKQVRTVGSGGLYSLVGEAAHAFVAHDRDLIGVILDRFDERSGVAGRGTKGAFGS